MSVKKVVRKSMVIRESFRSSDYISPSFGHGCLFNCSYCYMKRHKPDGLTVAKNAGDILTEINRHAHFIADVQKPNQTDPEYITYDISCNEDFALHAKFHPWKQIFDFFREHPVAKGTFATKTVPKVFLDYDPDRKIRIRFSLMPQKISDKLEPHTSSIADRLAAINTFIEAGYDVHLNYSPVVVYKGWQEDYRELFQLVNDSVKDEYKKDVLAEVIFLTHNVNKHHKNLEDNREGEDLLWTPKWQEEKTSQYGGNNLRYHWQLKRKLIESFKEVHAEVVPWNKIRYIF